MLDSILPRYEVREYHETMVSASPEAALMAALAMPAASDPVVAALFWLRRIPGGELPLGEFIRGMGFRPAIATERAVVGIGEVSGVRIAFGLWADPLGPGRSRLATETRVRARDASARRGFRLYWLAVGPFSGLIRRRWLAVARRRAELA
ncbi:MAG TPA: hypothetical protein VGR87_13750 [Candidatus Limnocylindria bacterium]|nr:hypothetical protein [Candidatus Limnocylindria bacterium]